MNFKFIPSYPEPIMQDLHEVEQTVQQKIEKFQKMYSYLSKTEDMSQEENKQEAIRIIDLMIEHILQFR